MEKPNLEYVDQLSAGDDEFKKTILEVLKNEFFEELSVYKSNFELKKLKELSDNVHKIKHKISILGMGESYKLASDYESNLRENNMNLNKEFNDILKAMEDFVYTL